MKNALLTLSALAMFTPAVWAADEAPAKPAGSNVSTTKGKDGNGAGVSTLEEALRLVSFARENESPVAMVTAVQMIEQTPAHQDEKLAKAPATQPAEQASDNGKSAAAPTLDAQKLLAEAEGWAKNDPGATAMIKAEEDKAKTQRVGTLGATAGPVVHYDAVSGLQTDVYHVTFDGGDIARIAVVGNGNSDLDLYVYDQGGHLIEADEDNTDRCVVQWTPAWTGQFEIHVVNRGRYANAYALLTN